VQGIHSLNIAHRDLKPENFLYASKMHDSALKITDFGFSKLAGCALTTPVYTPYYVAPEVLTTKHKETHGYAKSCDLWSLGVIIFMILSGRPPFYNSEFSGDITPGMSSRICAAQYDFQGEEWDAVSGPAKDLVRRLLKSDPKLRLTADEVLSHPWLSMTESAAAPLSTPQRLASDPGLWQQAQVCDSICLIRSVEVQVPLP